MSPLAAARPEPAALPAQTAPQNLPRLHLFAQLTASAAFLLLLAGALVTSTGSSLAVPDWPLSFGKAFPPMIGGVLFEHGHRMIAGMVALLTLGLTLWTRLVERRAWVRRLAYAASGAILLQAVLGGLTVLLRLPPLVSISHACLGQAVFCLLVSIAQATSPWYLRPDLSWRLGAFWKTGALAVAAVYIQLILGAVVRHTGQALPIHAAWACLVTALACSLIYKTLSGGAPELLGPSLILAALLPAQLVLGFASYRLRFSLDFVAGLHPAAVLTAAHLAVGALILASSLTWSLRAHRLK